MTAAAVSLTEEVGEVVQVLKCHQEAEHVLIIQKVLNHH